MTNILIGIDDTDVPGSPGTGKLARLLAEEIEHAGGKYIGTTGHQFLIDPQIPYTGHNRGICVGIEWRGDVHKLEFVFERVQGWSAEGSDPGVCLANTEAVNECVVAWGHRALDEVLTMKGAALMARERGLDLRPLGGTGQGIIGALASVGLRKGGEVGRFVDMPGLRALEEVVTVEQLERMGISVTGGQRAGVVKTLGWVRPRLAGGKALLELEWSEHDDAWVPVDRKKEHSLEQT